MDSYNRVESPKVRPVRRAQRPPPASYFSATKRVESTKIGVTRQVHPSVASYDTDRIVVSSEKIHQFHMYPANKVGIYAGQVQVPEVVARRGRRGPPETSRGTSNLTSEASPAEASTLNTPRPEGRRMKPTPPSRADGYAGLDTRRAREQIGRRTQSAHSGRALWAPQALPSGFDLIGHREVSGTPRHNETVLVSVRGHELRGGRRSHTPGPKHCEVLAPWDQPSINTPRDGSQTQRAQIGRRPMTSILSKPFVPGSKVFTNQHVPPRIDLQAGYRNRVGNLSGIL